MTAFRLFLGLCFIAIASYTAVTIGTDGWNLLPVFFGDMVEMRWPGQFNFDFFTLLLLAGLWVAWRHQFRPVGIALGLCATLGGMFFLSAYLLVHSYQSGGDMAALLMGPERARG